VAIRRSGAPFNVQMVDASIYAREKAPQLDYRDQTANFVIGQTIKGGTSGATAVIEDDVDHETFGTLTISQIKGTFQPDEPISSGGGGAAVVDGSLREGIWVLDFAFKPIRIQDVDIPGRGRRHVYYLYYRVVNRTGKPRMFVPQFTLITNPGKPNAKRYEDRAIPQAIRVIQNREDPGIPLVGAVESTGILPPSNREGIDDALFGVALWEGIDPTADTFRVYVRGLSDGYNLIPPPSGSGQPLTQYKALQINCETPGNNAVRTEREIFLSEPPFEWVYYPPMPGGTAANLRRQ